MQPIFLTPVFKQMIWGGNRLHNDFGYETPGENTGECWGISSHPNGDCAVAGGTYAGETLSSLWTGHRELFGNYPGERFPLLIKLIDAKEDLSIQVHPDDAYAKEHENASPGKTECWYILDCAKDAEIVIGHYAKNRQEMEEMIRSRRWSDFIRKVPIRRGDFFQIDPGCLHAIKGGTFLLETQQNSDITYRIYDYDRLSNGKPRELHLQKGLEVLRAPFVPSTPQVRTVKGADYELTNLITCDYYTVNRLTVHGIASFIQDMPFLNMSVIEGEGAIDEFPIHKGDHFILPFGYGNYTVSGNLTLICSGVPKPCQNQ